MTKAELLALLADVDSSAPICVILLPASYSTPTDIKTDIPYSVADALVHQFTPDSWQEGGYVALVVGEAQ